MNANSFVYMMYMYIYLFVSSDSHPEDCSANIYKSMALSYLASFPFVYFNTKRPLSLFQFLVGKGGKSRKQFHVIIYPCLCAMLGPSKENMKLVL